MNKYFYRSIDVIEDVEAASQMSFAALLGGIGFGNAGVHMCHAISYAISGSVREYCPPGYSKDHPIIPHGLSVVMTAPAVFNEVGYVAPDRCIHLAGLLGNPIYSYTVTCNNQIKTYFQFPTKAIFIEVLLNEVTSCFVAGCLLRRKFCDGKSGRLIYRRPARFFY